MRILARWLSRLVLAAVLAVFGLAVVVPAVMGASTLTVLTGSMRPTIQPGDLVVVRPVDAADIKIGDVITFRPDANSDELITHRVVEQTVGREQTWTTRGDANNTDDDPIVFDQIRGKVAYSLPYLGWVRQWLSSAGPAPLVGVAGVMVVALFWPLISKLWRRNDATTTDNTLPDAGVPGQEPSEADAGVTTSLPTLQETRGVSS